MQNSHTHRRDVLYRGFGIERFQVLTLTTSKERIRTMQDAYREHIPRELRRPNLFLFAELSEIDLDTDVFALTWHNANGKPTKLTVQRPLSLSSRCLDRLKRIYIITARRITSGELLK